MPALLQLINLSLSVVSTPLIDSVNAQVVTGQRVAIVGANGAGKSTLLRALAAPNRASYFMVGAGRITRSIPDESVLFVEQDALQWSMLLGGNEKELRSLPLQEALDLALVEGNEDAGEDAEAWRRLHVAAHDLLEWRTACYDTTPLGKLSPGCAMRAYLALALHRTGIELLLLDEPTNHLDLPSILWLQQSILASGKTVVMVSHDTSFLDAVCDHVWAIDNNKKSLAVSGASYSDFRHAEQVAREQQMAAFESQERRYKRLTQTAEKLRAASAAGANYQSRDHDTLQRDFKRDRAGASGRKAKAVETMRDAGERVERVVQRRALQINITPLGAGPDSSMILGDVVLGYGGKPLGIPAVSLRIDFGERCALVGFNGAGKSTLLKTLAGGLEPAGGAVAVGRELRVGNLMQEHENMPREETPREHLAELTGVGKFEAGKRLINFGLTRQQVDCSIAELNPGARARALLAGFAMRKVNALVLDEPTNHLDEEAVQEVTATVNEFEGTVLVVTHSRALLQSLRLSRVLRLSADGLTEVASVEDFVDGMEKAVDKVVAACWGDRHVTHWLSRRD